MDNFRTSGPIDNPMPAQTYGGFAAPRPAESAGWDDLQPTAPTYAEPKMRRVATRRSRSPNNLSVAGVALVALAALVGVGITQIRWATPGPPAQTREPGTQSKPVQGTDLPPPAPSPAPSPVVAAPSAAAPAAEPASETPPVVRLDTARGVEAPTAAGPAPPIPNRRAEKPTAPAKPTAFAALDRQVNAAFAAAMRSGAAAGPLGREQQDWIVRANRIRREDPGAAEDLYRARVAELHALASRDAEPPPAPVAQTDPESRP